MIRNKLIGTGVALITPFNENGSIDFKGLENLINHCITGGVEYLVSLGTTGESVNLSSDEKKELLKFTVEKASGRVSIVAGFGGNNTSAVIEDLETYDLSGIDAVLSVSPYYNKPSQEGIYRHYKAIAEASPKPVLLYNVPGRTASNMKAETTLRIAKDCENVIGIKEASGDFIQCMEIIQKKPAEFLVISGDDNITLPLISIGAQGVISVSGQAFPRKFTDMVRLALSGKFTEAAKLHYELFEVTNMLFEEGNPAGVKCALELQGICQSHLRLPLVNISASLQARMKTVMKM